MNDATGLKHEPAGVDASASVLHVLPLKWSLSYALTKKQWQEVRERHKRLHPEWMQCHCPKRCAASDLDEHWEYDQENHLKRFIGAKFICRGCHWLKSLPHRIQTWLRQQRGLMPKLMEPPHIIGASVGPASRSISFVTTTWSFTGIRPQA